MTLTDDIVDLTDTATKINPPLRGERDTAALFAALKDGTIDMIVTDHSPHAAEEKDREYGYAPSGFPGLETSLGVMLTDFWHTGELPLPQIIAKMTSNPARIFGLPYGTLSAGKAADVTIIDPDYRWTVDPAAFYTKCRISPFKGKKLRGKAVLTMVAGEIVMRDGRVIER